MHDRELLSCEDGSFDDERLALEINLEQGTADASLNLEMARVAARAQAVVDELEDGRLSG
jgi:hypothetical protein